MYNFIYSKNSQPLLLLYSVKAAKPHLQYKFISLYKTNAKGRLKQGRDYFQSENE